VHNDIGGISWIKRIENISSISTQIGLNHQKIITKKIRYTEARFWTVGQQHKTIRFELGE